MSDSRAPRRPATSSRSPSSPRRSAARRSGASRSSASAVAARPKGSSSRRGSPPAASSSSERRTAAFSSSSSTTTSRPAKKHNIVHCSAGAARSSARTQSRTVSRAMPVVLAEFRDERVPAGRRAGILEARDEAAPRVDQEERRLVGRAEAPCERALRVAERRPRPAVAAHERPCGGRSVSCVQAEEVEPLPLLPNPPRVGDRLAVAGASPGRPDVDHHRLATQVGEREPLPVEGDAGDGRLLRGGRGGGRGHCDQEDD